MDDALHPFRPQGALPAAPLAAYRGPWNARLAAHLLRRAGFGGAPAEIARFAQGSMHDAVTSLVLFPSAANLPSGPDDLPSDGELAARILAVRAGEEPGAAPDANAVAMREQLRALVRRAIISLQLWWIDRMIATPAPLQEKMTLFWHGHFTTAAVQKGVSPAATLAQNALFRSFALGNVRELTQRVAVDPAMLRYLDNIHNEAAHPNENFARELIELYTLGIGNYTESDVREAARAWTGLRIRRATGEVYLNERLHDAGSKTFLGRTGNFGGSEIIDIIFQQPAAARYFATKLLTFFVYADPEPELVDAVAGLLRTHDFALAPVMTALLSSNVFYSARAYRALVKSPVEFVVGSYRLFGVPAAQPEALGALRRMTQVLFYPPNVKGWPGGSAWLNTSTVLARENFANALMTANVVNDSSWLLAAGPGNVERAAAAIVDAIVQNDVSTAARSRLEAYLAGTDSAALGALSAENFDQRMRGGAYLTMAMPAYQLA
ncbi:MAG: DUF1800 domain-containing protein [Candidatus Velthaea sp.]